MDLSGQLQALLFRTPVKNTVSIHSTKGWVDPIDSVDVLEERKAQIILIQTREKQTNIMEATTNVQEHTVTRMRRRYLKPLIQSEVLCSTCV
jgi:hypothetical protein